MRRMAAKWGYSSVGRAVALQAIGLGFESPCLHQFFRQWGDSLKRLAEDTQWETQRENHAENGRGTTERIPGL